MGDQLLTHDLTFPASIDAAASQLASDGGPFVRLDSSNADRSDGRHGRFSILASQPIAEITQHPGHPARFTINGRVVDEHANAWRLLRNVMPKMALACPADGVPGPGWIGWLAFELGNQLEPTARLRDADVELPLVRLGLFDRVIILDHARQRASMRATPDLRNRLSAPARPIETDLDRWERACRAAPPSAAPCRVRALDELAPAEFERMVARAIDYIAAGDVYQVNLAHRIRLEGLDALASHYARLRHHNPAPFGALLQFGDDAVLSVSPELFLRVRGRRVLTSPIKGTRPRIGDTVIDDAYRRELLHSEKDAAELAMIIDLHRNDLGRVCDIGSVEVAEPRRLETHPRVIHTVADVTGRLRADRDAIDLLAAAFPAGSVTGVPKIRAMQIIAELEPAPRGVYTGAIGHFDLRGDMTLSVAIRTVQVRRGLGWLHVGGGIVADSTPADEYAETIAKARGIVEALAGAESPVLSQGSVD